MWLISDGVTGSEFRFLSFVWSKMLAGLDVKEKPTCPKGLEKVNSLMVYLITVIQVMLSLIAASFQDSNNDSLAQFK